MQANCIPCTCQSVSLHPFNPGHQCSPVYVLKPLYAPAALLQPSLPSALYPDRDKVVPTHASRFM